MIEQAVRSQLQGLLHKHHNDNIDFDAHLFDELGLTSINLVVLMTSLCEDLEVSLFEFTEADLARLKRPRDIVNLFSSRRQEDNSKGGSGHDQLAS
jgi:acyl carrier protein